MVSSGAAAWRVTVRPQGASVSSLGPGLLPPAVGCDARIESDPETFLRWAYNRPLTQPVVATGDKPMLEQFKRLLTAVTGVS